MRWRDEREHEPCPHCGRNACSWHMPGRFCVYAYEDLPGDVKRKPVKSVLTMRESEKRKGLTGG
jgi:hypothetical protein